MSRVRLGVILSLTVAPVMLHGPREHSSPFYPRQRAGSAWPWQMVRPLSLIHVVEFPY